MPPIPTGERAAVFGARDVEAMEPLRPRPLGATVGVWRVRAEDSSAVLKLLRIDASPNPNWAASPDPTHPRWWRRELEVLQTGIVKRLEPELRPPRLLHHADREDGSLALWLEDLDQPAVWTVERIAEVAHRLGLAQVRVMREGRSSGLATGFLRAYLKPRRRHLAPPFGERCDELLSMLDTSAQTICHFDLHPANVFPRSGETAVIDWAYCGLGPLGTDPGVLASDAIADGLIAPEEAEALVDAVWDAYRAGLGDEYLVNHQADRVYSVGTALRYSWLRAWLRGRYGPEVPAGREPFLKAAHDVFRLRAMRFL